MAFLTEANVIALSMQSAKWLLFADLLRVTRNPVMNKGAFALGVGSADSNAHPITSIHSGLTNISALSAPTWAAVQLRQRDPRGRGWF